MDAHKSVAQCRAAILSPRSGHVVRGTEVQAYEFKRRLRCQSAIFSLFESPLTWPVHGIKRTDRFFPLLTLYTTAARLTKFYRLFRNGPIELSTAEHVEELTFGLNLDRALDRFQPNVVLNLGGPTVGVFARRYCDRHTIPLLTVSGAGIGRIELWNAQTKPDCLIVPTPALERFLREAAPHLRIVLIPNGADVERFHPVGPRYTDEELRQRSLLPDPVVERPVILSTSAMTPNKRLETLIEACALLKRGTLVMTGTGDQQARLLALARARLGKKCIYLGAIPYEDIDRVYRTCDVFCLPSINEPFGLVFVEAMACGLPVVADRDDDREWLIGPHGGLLTDVRDIQALAQALQEAASRDWQGGPRKHVEARFSWEVTVRELERVIEELVATTACTPSTALG